MKVKDLMTTDVTTVAPDSLVTDAAKIMERLDIGAVPVCVKNNVVGILTDRDIVLRNIAQGKDPNVTQIKDVMTGEVYTATPDMDLDDVTDIMAEHQIRRVPVVENNKLVGILAIGDIAIEDDYDFETSDALSEISEDNNGRNE